MLRHFIAMFANRTMRTLVWWFSSLAMCECAVNGWTQLLTQLTDDTDDESIVRVNYSAKQCGKHSEALICSESTPSSTVIHWKCRDTANTSEHSWLIDVTNAKLSFFYMSIDPILITLIHYSSFVEHHFCESFDCINHWNWHFYGTPKKAHSSTYHAFRHPFTSSSIHLP